jgi:hypothetical protein
MTRSLIRCFGHAALLAVAGLASGCVFTISTNADSYPVAAVDVPALPAGTSVNVVNGASSYMARFERNQQADLHEVTQAAVEMLGRALEKKGAVRAEGGRRIVLQVTSVEWRRALGTARATVSLDAELESGKLSAWGESAGLDPGRDFSAATSHAVEDLLRKPELCDYLARPGR